MERIYQLCSSIKRLDERQQIDAVVRMCIAHVLNGGEYTGVYETAAAYLEGL